MSDNQPLTPLTPEEAARILKISKYTLYELIKRGQIPAQRIGRQLRIDPAFLNAYLQGTAILPQIPNDTLNLKTSFLSIEESKPDSLLEKLHFSGSNEPIIELLQEFLRHSTVPVEFIPHYTGSMEGLINLYKRKSEIAGIHLWDAKTEDYNLPFVQYVLPTEAVTIVNLVQRVQGWIVPQGNPYDLQAWQDIVQKGLRFINRQKGSGTRLRIDGYLQQAGISPAMIRGYELEETTHFGVACAVATGKADAGIGVQAAAHRLNLGFIPLFHERYDIVCLQETTLTAKWQHLMSILTSAPFHLAINSEAGYDTTLTGQVLFNS